MPGTAHAHNYGGSSYGNGCIQDNFPQVNTKVHLPGGSSFCRLDS